MKNRSKMPISERAKQFAPFSPLTGLGRALSEKERIKTEKRELSEDMAEEIGLKLSRIACGEMVTAVFYENDEYIKITGMVSAIDLNNRCITIVDKKIETDNIFSLTKQEKDTETPF